MDEAAQSSTKLDLNQAVANENEEEIKGECEDKQADAEDVARVSEDNVDHAVGNGGPSKLSSAAPDGDNEPTHEVSESPRKKSRKRTLSPSPSPAGRGSRSPSPKKRRSSPTGQASSSRSPTERRGRSPSLEERQGRHKSPRRRDDSHRRDDGRRRRDRSRSPVARYHHRERSRSRSPRDRERSRYRSRYSPRRSSPPPRYSSRGGRSPRKRPWSPPRNRDTGLGKPGNHLFVAGFSFATTERDLERKFGIYGRVSDVRIIRDRRSGDSRGFGFLSLERDDEADAAIEALDQTEWNGRIVLVEKAKTT
ncbi:hypothetical protein KP509_07G081500 [Ceratopteris richardii]|uniref:RRM domain-containing protein n=1 Tax=Ceratopteris richardii TaxID=49495 RepID=A0A8T2UE08_CERRI|nr:hypothetical protein KP509_07G081500 [Ceratopteris richardii]